VKRGQGAGWQEEGSDTRDCRDWQHLMCTQHGTAASMPPSVGSNPLPSPVLLLLCSLVFTCQLRFPQKLALSRLAIKKAPSHLPCAQTLVLEGAPCEASAQPNTFNNA